MTKEYDPTEDMEFIDEDFDADDEDVIILTLDDDTEITCFIVGVFGVENPKYEGKEYIALEVEGGEDILLYGYSEEENGEFDLRAIEEEDELVAVSAAFEELMAEMSGEEN